MEHPGVLIVRHEYGICEAVEEMLRRLQYSVDRANDGGSAVRMLALRSYAVVFTGLRLADMSGAALIERARRTHATTQFVLMTAPGNIEESEEGLRAGAYDYVTDPFDQQRLRVVTRKAIEFCAVLTELRTQKVRAGLGMAVVDPAPPPAAAAPAVRSACEVQPGMTIAECEKMLIRETLLHGTTNREQAARMLGISRRALQYKLKWYGLLPPRAGILREPSAATVASPVGRLISAPPAPTH